MGKIVHRYIFREILIPFVFGLSVFTFVLLIARLLKLIELVVSRGVPPGNIMRLVGYILPAFLEVTVPMAMLLAILVAFGRLSADSEIVALRSSGLSLYQLILPVATFALLATLATAVLSMYARPWGYRSLRTALFDIARARATAGIKPQVFNDEFPGLVIYTESIDPATDRLQRVLISDEREPSQHNNIFAREALMISDPTAETVTLRLQEGFIHTVDTIDGAEYQTDFRSYEVSLDLRQLFAGAKQREQDPKELTLPQLRQVMASKEAAGQPMAAELVEYHRKFSIPFACVVFALAAVPLGVQPVRGARSRGFAVSLAMIFAYYIVLSAGQAMAEQHLLPAVVGLWLPNALFLAIGLYLFSQAAKERAVLQLEWLRQAASALWGRVAARLGVEAAP